MLRADWMALMTVRELCVKKFTVDTLNDPSDWDDPSTKPTTTLVLDDGQCFLDLAPILLPTTGQKKAIGYYPSLIILAMPILDAGTGVRASEETIYVAYGSVRTLLREERCTRK
ncbi:MAG: hypothetical protein Q9212_000075 [Teloschistes hypoglaucus]